MSAATAPKKAAAWVLEHPAAEDPSYPSERGDAVMQTVPQNTDNESQPASDYSRRLTETILTALDGADWTIGRLAKLAEIETPALAGRLSGRYDLTVNEVGRIADALGCLDSDLYRSAEVNTGYVRPDPVVTGICEFDDGRFVPYVAVDGDSFEEPERALEFISEVARAVRETWPSVDVVDRLAAIAVEVGADRQDLRTTSRELAGLLPDVLAPVLSMSSDFVAEVWNELETCPTWSFEDFDLRLGRVGRNNGPELLAAAYIESAIDDDAVKATIGGIWSMSEYPDHALDHETWRWLFDVAGYTVDGKPAQRPTEPLRLYRGSVTERLGDWSWTDNREVAEQYASGTHYHRPKSHVWTAAVEPWRLLARNTERQEDEYVVDTDGLKIEVIDEL